MSEVKNLLNFYSSSLTESFAKIMQPLTDCFNLNATFYSFMTPEGYFYQIGNHPGVANLYFSNHLYKCNPLICHPDNYSHNQILIAKDLPDPVLHNAQTLIDKTYGLDNCIALYKKKNGMAHSFKFSTTNKNLRLTTLFANQLNSLSSFGDYFIEKWKDLHSKMDPYTINLGNLMGPRYFQFNPDIQIGFKKSKIKEFLFKIGKINKLHLDFFDLTQFTRREIECIEKLLKGKTAKQISLELGLSTRTIEHYLDNIKSKMACSTKAELFEVFQTIQNNNLF